MAQREQRVTPLELFFDLVFVYAITQVTQLMSHDPTWRGVARGVLVLAALWWAWTGYAWLTNTLEPEEGQVRAGMFGAMAALLVVALAVPEAFESDAVLFGVAYLIVRLLHLLLYTIAGKRDPDLLGAVLRFTPSATLAPAIILAAGFVDGRARVALWVVALAVDYLGALIGHGAGWRVSPAHFAERHGLIAITALWWSYFDVIAVLAQRQLSETSGATQARLARDYYSYLHLPMIAGIVLFALGLKRTIEQIDEPLATIPAVALCGGLSLYFLTHVALRIRLVHFIRRATTERPGWIGPGPLVTGVCCALIAWDVIHYREHRIEVRQARP